MKQKQYIAIDLKSFYASVECVERGLDPLTTNLVVADVSRTEKTICLAVSPSLKAYGIPGRARLFEVVQKAREAGISYTAAPPRMALYILSGMKPRKRIVSTALVKRLRTVIFLKNGSIQKPIPSLPSM